MDCHCQATTWYGGTYWASGASRASQRRKPQAILGRDAARSGCGTDTCCVLPGAHRNRQGGSAVFPLPSHPVFCLFILEGGPQAAWVGAAAQGVAGRWPVFLERGCGPGVCRASLVSRLRDEGMACWAGEVGGQTPEGQACGVPLARIPGVSGPLCSLLSWGSCCSHGGFLWLASILPGLALWGRISYGYVGK